MYLWQKIIFIGSTRMNFTYLIKIMQIAIDRLIWICYKRNLLTNGVHQEKKKTPDERKRLTAGNGFVIKFDFAGQLFATA